MIFDKECKRYEGFYRAKDKFGKCQLLNESYRYEIKDEMICGESDETSSCYGDSGGPYTVKKNGQHVLVGVINGGLGRAEVTLIKTQAQHMSIIAPVNQFLKRLRTFGSFEVFRRQLN